MTNIPKEIKKKIEGYVVNKYSTHDMSESEKAMLRSSINVQRENSIEDVSYGYSLAMQEVGEKDKEIERLKGLIEKAYNLGGDHEAGEFNQYQTFNDFKTKHNI